VRGGPFIVEVLVTLKFIKYAGYPELETE